jgi:hypothetical protein
MEVFMQNLQAINFYKKQQALEKKSSHARATQEQKKTKDISNRNSNADKGIFLVVILFFVFLIGISVIDIAMLMHL